MTVTRSSGDGALTLDYVLEPAGGATATAGQRLHRPAVQKVYFAPGQTTATITFTVSRRRRVEPNESFVVRLLPNPPSTSNAREGSSRSRTTTWHGSTPRGDDPPHVQDCGDLHRAADTHAPVGDYAGRGMP